jgi:hypothetical protein
MKNQRSRGASSHPSPSRPPQYPAFVLPVKIFGEAPGRAAPRASAPRIWGPGGRPRFSRSRGPRRPWKIRWRHTSSCVFPVRRRGGPHALSRQSSTLFGAIFITPKMDVKTDRAKCTLTYFLSGRMCTDYSGFNENCAFETQVFLSRYSRLIGLYQFSGIISKGDK